MKRLHYLILTTFFFLLSVGVPLSAAASPVVLFDQSHGQQFLVEENRPLDLSGLASAFAREGAEIITTRTPLTGKLLNGVNVLVISGSFRPISEGEIDAILHFMEGGGKLAVMVHISQPFLSLFKRLGVVISSLPVNERKHVIGGNPKNFLVTDMKPHPLTRNLDAFAVYGGWALKALRSGVSEIAHTSKEAWVDLNQNGELNERDARQAFALMVTGGVGRGLFTVFGDDAIFQNQFLRGGNLQLAENLARWFCSQQKTI